MSKRGVRGAAMAAVLLLAAGPARLGAQDGSSAAVGPRPGLDELKLLGGGIVFSVAAPGRWGARDWLAVPVAGGGLVALSALDGELRDVMRRSRGRDLDGFADVIEELGTVNNFSVLAGFFAAGLVLDDARARAVAAEGLASSVIAAGLITPTLQFVVGRSRPWTGDDPHTLDAFSRNISFPSGHTTQAFAVAAVIATEYEQLWVKALAYGLAGLVGVSRMYHDAHYLTDVAAAAAIGTVVGRSVAGYGQRRRDAVSLRPALTSRAPGVGLTLRF